MSPARTSARERARRRAERLEMLRFAERLQQRARADIVELDRLRRPALGAEHAVVIEGRIVDGKIITETD
jgi:hypothetical protein